MGRTSDEQDSTVALWGNYMLCGLILGLLFVTDWVFEKDVLSETLVGILVGAPIGWVASMNAYYFPSARNGKQPDKTEGKPDGGDKKV